MKTTLRKMLAVLLCAVMLVAPVGMFASAEGGELKLYVASDIHFRPYSAGGDIEPKAADDTRNDLYYYADPLGKMYYESTAIIKSMLADVAASDAPYLLIPGDLCNVSARNQEIEMAALLAEFEATSGKKVFVVPGNHDLVAESDSYSIDYREFEEIYAQFGYDEALANHDESASYTVDLNSEYRLLAVDSIDYGKVAGDIDQSTLDWIAQQVEQAKADGKKIIAMMHHSLLSHFTLNTTIVGGFDTLSAGDLATRFADWGIKYVFTGHLHVNDITMATTSNGNRIYDVSTGCLISSPNMFRKVTFSDTEVKLEACYVDSVDAADLPGGYSEEQLNVMLNDFTAYCTGMCRYGLENWLEEYLSAAKLLKNRSTDDPVYVAVDRLLSKLRSVARFPLYDSGTPEIDSIEEICKITGASLPESNYEYPLDVAYVYLHGFYAGDSSIPMDSLETRLVLNTVKAGLTYTIGQIADKSSLGKGLSEILADRGVSSAAAAGMLFTTGMADHLYAQTAANAVIDVLLKPFLESFSADAYAPDDLNVTLAPYGADKTYVSDGGVPLTFFQKLIAFLKVVYEAVTALLKNLK